MNIWTRTVTALLPATLATVGLLAVASPAAATTTATAGRKTCDTQIQQVTVGGVKKTRLSVTGRPANAAKVYSFRLTWGWTNTVSTYIPRYRVYDAPRHTPLTKAESWVNGYKCNDWYAGQIF